MPSKTVHAGLVTIALLGSLAGCAPMAETPMAAPAAPAPPTAPSDPAQTAAVAMPDHHSADAAEAVLREGGNAIDAAIAAGFVLAVTLPEAGNIGGGGFMLMHVNGTSRFLDYREIAPAGASRDMYLDDDGNVIEKSTLIGALAAGIPGTVNGFWEAHRVYGTLPWKRLLMPAIRLAEEGFVAPSELAASVQNQQDWHGPRTNFMAHFGHMRGGERFVQPQLAATLRRIADDGPDGFYRGATADYIVAQMQRDGGLITHDDLAEYTSTWREPLSVDWRGRDLVTAPPPSGGGAALIQLLGMKEALADAFAGLEHNSWRYVHLIAEIEKRVFADRAEYFGDPAFVDIELDRLLSDSYIATRAAEVSLDSISDAGGVRPGLESPDTTHYSIVDGYGNAVANTYTINWEFGSGVVVDGAGFLLNNEMDDFSAKPGVPNIFGVVGNDANAIAAGKKPLSSMTPTLILNDGSVELVAGTRGGSTIFTSVFQAINNIYDFDMTPQEAADVTRFHHQLIPANEVTYSPNRPLHDATVQALNAAGYVAKPHGWVFGDLQLIHRDANGVLRTGSDTRGRGVGRLIDAH